MNADVMRDPNINFLVPLSLDLVPARATAAAPVMKRTFISANEPRIFRPSIADIPRTNELPSLSPWFSATTDVVRSVRFKITLKSNSTPSATSCCARYDTGCARKGCGLAPGSLSSFVIDRLPHRLVFSEVLRRLRSPVISSRMDTDNQISNFEVNVKRILGELPRDGMETFGISTRLDGYVRPLLKTSSHYARENDAVPHSP